MQLIPSGWADNRVICQVHEVGMQKQFSRYTSVVGLVVLALLLGPLADCSWAQTPVEEVGEVELGNATYEPLELPEALPRFNELFKQVARRVRPTVVFIEVEVPTERQLPKDGDHELDEDFLRKYFDPPIQDSAGSGVLLSRSGYIVTNHHVVKDAVAIRVQLEDRRKYKAEVVGTDPTTDLAVLQIVGTDEEFPAVALGNSDKVEVGEWIVAVGNPFRLTSTVTAGIVSAKGRQVNIIENELGIEDFIQTDAAINPGNSGGALINLRGELIGINTAIATRNGVSEGYGFAVPVNLVQRVVQDLIRYGEVRRGYLGVHISQVTSKAAQEQGLDHMEGVLIQQVARDGAAEQAGLLAGDIVVGVEERTVSAPNELQSAIAQYRPGDVVRLKVRREGDLKYFSVTLFGPDNQAFQDWLATSRSAQEGKQAQETFSLEVIDEWGLGLRDVNPEQSQMFDVKAGAYVAYVEGGSPASNAGLPRDAVITAIEDQTIGQAGDVKEILQKVNASETTVLMRVKRRDGTVGFYELEPPVEDQ